jgi:hypothetical protein
MSARSFSTNAAKGEGINIRPQFGDEKGHLVSHQSMHIAAEVVQAWTPRQGT